MVARLHRNYSRTNCLLQIQRPEVLLAMWISRDTEIFYSYSSAPFFSFSPYFLSWRRRWKGREKGIRIGRRTKGEVRWILGISFSLLSSKFSFSSTSSSSSSFSNPLFFIVYPSFLSSYFRPPLPTSFYILLSVSLSPFSSMCPFVSHSLLPICAFDISQSLIQFVSFSFISSFSPLFLFVSITLRPSISHQWNIQTENSLCRVSKCRVSESNCK